MTHVSQTDLRQNLSMYLDQVADDRAPLVITRTRGSNAVLMSEAEFAGWQETVYLLSSPRNAAELLASIQEIRDGKYAEHELVAPPG
jgi:antitoxin YefM